MHNEIANILTDMSELAEDVEKNAISDEDITAAVIGIGLKIDKFKVGKNETEAENLENKESNKQLVALEGDGGKVSATNFSSASSK